MKNVHCVQFKEEQIHVTIMENFVHSMDVRLTRVLPPSHRYRYHIPPNANSHTHTRMIDSTHTHAHTHTHTQHTHTTHTHAHTRGGGHADSSIFKLIKNPPIYFFYL